MGQGQPSFPGEMISGLVISERMLTLLEKKEADVRAEQSGGAGV